MIFSGDCQCVYCGCKINFSGNNISYQNQQCATHNPEHQFPGMNIIVKNSNYNSINNLHLKNLPISTKRKSTTKTFKHPNVFGARSSTIFSRSQTRNITTRENTDRKGKNENFSPEEKSVAQN